MTDGTSGGHLEAERISAYMEGDLDPADAAEVEAHLEGCGRCREVLSELRDVVERARRLPDAPPERDLWPGLRKAITGGEAGRTPVVSDGSVPGGADVTAFPGSPEERRGYRLSGVQLAAAAAALIFFSGAGAWLVHPGGSGSATAGSGPVDAGTSAARVVAEDAPEVPEEYRSELERLQTALGEHRDELAPNTVRVLEKNLAVIDRAIRESREALRLDPGNPFLESHLDRAYRTKLEYLREATRIVEWSS